MRLELWALLALLGCARARSPRLPADTAQTSPTDEGTQPATLTHFKVLNTSSTWSDGNGMDSGIVSVGDNQRGDTGSRDLDDPKMFGMLRSHTAGLRYTPLKEFKWSNLKSKHAYALTIGNKYYIWVGKEAPKWYRRIVTSLADIPRVTADRFVFPFNLKKLLCKRPDALADKSYNVLPEVVEEGFEPEAFLAVFHKWDPEMEKTQRLKYKEEEAALTDDMKLTEIDS